MNERERLTRRVGSVPRQTHSLLGARKILSNFQDNFIRRAVCHRTVNLQEHKQDQCRVAAALHRRVAAECTSDFSKASIQRSIGHTLAGSLQFMGLLWIVSSEAMFICRAPLDFPSCQAVLYILFFYRNIEKREADSSTRTYQLKLKKRIEKDY